MIRHAFSLVACLTVCWFAGLAQAQPELTEAQQLQHATAVSPGPIDEGALYAVLAAASAWEPASDAGARIPDYPKIEADPDKARGDYFLIEGAFVDAGELTLARGGPWGTGSAKPPVMRDDGVEIPPARDRLKYWVVKYGDVESERGEDVAVILFVDPHDTLKAPRQRQPVRVPAMFHKLWRNDVGNASQPETADFKTFVARADVLSSVMVGPAVKEGGKGFEDIVKSPVVMVGILVVLGIAWLMIRRTLKAADQAGAYARQGYGSHATADEQEPEVEYRDDLPEDPVEAMSVMKTEHDVAEAEASKKPKVDPADALARLQTEHEKDEA